MTSEIINNKIDFDEEVNNKQNYINISENNSNCLLTNIKTPTLPLYWWAKFQYLPLFSGIFALINLMRYKFSLEVDKYLYIEKLPAQKILLNKILLY